MNMVIKSVDWINQFRRDFSKLADDIYGATENTKLEVQLV